MASTKVTKGRSNKRKAKKSLPRREYAAALEKAGVTSDDLALLRDLAEQNERLRAERSVLPLTRIFL